MLPVAQVVHLGQGRPKGPPQLFYADCELDHTCP
jgi:hypothetical protein